MATLNLGDNWNAVSVCGYENSSSVLLYGLLGTGVTF